MTAPASLSEARDFTVAIPTDELKSICSRLRNNVLLGPTAADALDAVADLRAGRSEVAQSAADATGQQLAFVGENVFKAVCTLLRASVLLGPAAADTLEAAAGMRTAAPAPSRAAQEPPAQLLAGASQEVLASLSVDPPSDIAAPENVVADKAREEAKEDDGHLAWLEPCNTSARQQVYVVTIASYLHRSVGDADVRDPNEVELTEFRGMLTDAAANAKKTDEASGGRPRTTDIVVEKVVAAQRSGYMQAAVRFQQKENFVAVQKALLQRSRLQSHWNTSVPAWHEAVERAAGLAEDAAPAIGNIDIWRLDEKETTLYKEAKSYHDPKALTRKRELAVLGRGTKKPKSTDTKFNKFHFTNLVLTEGLKTKQQAIVHMRECGDEPMHTWAMNHQQQLASLIRDAWEWANPSVANDQPAHPAPKAKAAKQLLDFSELADLFVKSNVICEKSAWVLAGTMKAKGDTRLFNALGRNPCVLDLVAKILRATNPETIRNGTAQFKPEYPLTAFMPPSDVHRHVEAWLKGGWKTWVLILSGPGGLGKTDYACALMASIVKSWHFINRLDRLKDITWLPLQGLIVDEICLREQDIDDTKALLDLKKDRDIKCRNKDGVIPSLTARILCTNWEYTSFWPGEARLPEHKTPIERRHGWVPVQRDLRIIASEHPADEDVAAILADPYGEEEEDVFWHGSGFDEP